MKRILAALFLVLLAPALVFAQAGVPGTLTQQSPTMLNACVQGTQNSAAVGTGVTATITPPSGQYVYLCGFDYQFCNNATTAAVTNLFITTTGFQGQKYQFGSTGTATQASTCLTGQFYWPWTLKSSAAGTAVNIGAANLANWGMNVNTYYYTAP